MLPSSMSARACYAMPRLPVWVLLVSTLLELESVRVDEDVLAHDQELDQALGRRQQRRSHGQAWTATSDFQRAFLQRVERMRQRRRAIAALTADALEKEERAVQEEANSEKALAWSDKLGLEAAAQLRIGKFRKGLDGRPMRALAAKRDFAKRETLLKVPASLLVWSHGRNALEEFRRLGVPRRLLKADCAQLAPASDCGQLRLASAVLAAGGKTWWSDLAAQLPRWQDLSDYHPMVASEQLLSAFYELPLVQMVWNAKVHMGQLYEKYRDLGGTASEGDFNWANLAVMTTALAGPGGHGLLLAPVAGLARKGTPEEQNAQLQPRRGSSSSAAADETDALVLQASRDIQEGDEILLHSAAAPDDRFAMLWNFPLRGTAEPLTADACERLLRQVGAAVSSTTGPCSAPAHESQKAIFCAFSRLTLEHCPSPIM
eukprot:TRINITY_DN67115_c0_g1_i1.p1 TRINITY_DN67115_c0_g1~~TRINITY_DN67115_c0_g1_i1.p1  ORF type:complete len:432 (+),score=108.25 TRINITY_DN67115_c0_g1_i1:42-1337(+)